MLNQFLRRTYLVSRTREKKKSKQKFKNNKEQTHISLRKPNQSICVFMLSIWNNTFPKSHTFFSILYLPKKIWKYTGDFGWTNNWGMTGYTVTRDQNGKCAWTIPQIRELSQPNANRALLVEKHLFLTRTTNQIPFFWGGGKQHCKACRILVPWPGTEPALGS